MTSIEDHFNNTPHPGNKQVFDPNKQNGCVWVDGQQYNNMTREQWEELISNTELKEGVDAKYTPYSKPGAHSKRINELRRQHLNDTAET